MNLQENISPYLLEEKNLAVDHRFFKNKFIFCLVPVGVFLLVLVRKKPSQFPLPLLLPAPPLNLSTVSATTTTTTAPATGFNIDVVSCKKVGDLARALLILPTQYDNGRL